MNRFFLLTATLLAFLGCTTSIPVAVTKPALVNLQGVRSLVVFPVIYTSEDKVLGETVARYTQSQLTTALENANYFTLLKYDSKYNPAVEESEKTIPLSEPSADNSPVVMVKVSLENLDPRFLIPPVPIRNQVPLSCNMKTWSR